MIGFAGALKGMASAGNKAYVAQRTTCRGVFITRRIVKARNRIWNKTAVLEVRQDSTKRV